MLETKVQARIVTATDIAKNYMELSGDEAKRAAYWCGLDSDARDSVLAAVQLHLLRLIEHPDQWVPTAVEPSTTSQLHLRIALNLEAVDTEQAKRRVRDMTITKQEVIEALAETVRSMQAEEE